MGTPLGDFLRARRDSTGPGAVGLPAGGRRRAPGLRRSELAALAGISVEYLVRIEQGRDRNPSVAVVNALADALGLDAAEREHLRQLTKITGGKCVGARAQPGREVRPGARRLLDGLEPGVAVISNRLGDLLACTRGFEAVGRLAGLLDGDRPNLTRFVFTDPRARDVFPDWDRVADEQVWVLSCSPADDYSAAFRSRLSAQAGEEFTRRLSRHQPPARGVLRWALPGIGELRWDREILELPPADAQQLTVLFPADSATDEAVTRVLRAGGAALRVVLAVGPWVDLADGEASGEVACQVGHLVGKARGGGLEVAEPAEGRSVAFLVFEGQQGDLKLADIDAGRGRSGGGLLPGGGGDQEAGQEPRVQPGRVRADQVGPQACGIALLLLVHDSGHGVFRQRGRD